MNDAIRVRSADAGATDRSLLVVFRIVLGLGLTSFGEPIAHPGCFREAFVVRRRWLDERAFADLVALRRSCWAPPRAGWAWRSASPGPASRGPSPPGSASPCPPHSCSSRSPGGS
ncbi:MAG: chromate transporter [Geminicoccaceae bacterium]